MNYKLRIAGLKKRKLIRKTKKISSLKAKSLNEVSNHKDGLKNSKYRWFKKWGSSLR